MPLQSEFPIGSANIGGGGVSANSENGVVTRSDGSTFGIHIFQVGTGRPRPKDSDVEPLRLEREERRL